MKHMFLAVIVVGMLFVLAFAMYRRWLNSFQLYAISNETVVASHVLICSNVSPALFHSNLSIKIYESNYLGTTNTTIIGGSRNLKSPVGYGSDNIGTNFELHQERLIAIKTNGFDVLFTRMKNNIAQSNLVFFPFGKASETNTLGWKIVGAFK